MIYCDVQGKGCKVWCHVDCVGLSSGLSNSQGKHMERKVEAVIWPSCMSVDVSGVAVLSSWAAQLPPFYAMSEPSMWGDTNGR